VRKLRTKVIVSASTIATASGVLIATTPQAAHGLTITLHPILAPLINFLLAIPL
jgi:hypothetical protein